MRIAIVGSGISGLGCAHALGAAHEVTVFEADARPGGHSDTVEVPGNDGATPVDLGFIVYNERTYPRLTALFAELGVDTVASDMSFGASLEQAGIEYRLTNPATIFAQPRNIARPAFLRMLRDITRFNRAALELAAPVDEDDRSLGEFVHGLRLSQEFRDWFLVPLGSAIWSADPSSFLKFPASTYVRFMDNHGLLRVRDVPKWRTVAGGSRSYVAALSASLGERLRLGDPVRSVRRDATGVDLVTDAGTARFDRVVLAVHADQALALLNRPTATEREILGAIEFQPNRVTLHHDAAIMPRARRAWASWTVRVPAVGEGAATLSYWMNNLQPLDTSTQWFVSLNSERLIDPTTIAAQRDVTHPVFDLAARRAQLRRDEIQGSEGVYYAGAWWHNGFHEDGLRSGQEAADALLHDAAGT